MKKLNDGFRGAFKFFSMPMDFNKHCNMEYATRNIKSPLTCKIFSQNAGGLQSSDGLPSHSTESLFQEA